MRERSPIQSVAMLVGLVFLLVGILGFIPGITSNYDDLKFAGHDSDAQLLGIFDTSVLHNIVHLLFGVAGLALARTFAGARSFLIGGGVIYLALFAYGAIWGHDEGGANWISNPARHDGPGRLALDSHARGGRVLVLRELHAPHQKLAATTT